VHRAAQTFIRVELEAAPGEIRRLAFDEGRVRREHVGRVVDQDLDFNLSGGLDQGHATISQRQIIVLLHRHRDMLVAHNLERIRRNRNPARVMIGGDSVLARSLSSVRVRATRWQQSSLYAAPIRPAC